MPYQIQYIPTTGGVITTFSGIVTDEDVIRSVEDKCTSDEQVQSYRYAITDCTTVTEFNVSTSAILKNAQIAKAAFTVNQDILLVAAVPTDLIFGLSRIWQAYADESDHRTNLVRTREEAEAWVAERL